MPPDAFALLSSPLGLLELHASEAGLRRVQFWPGPPAAAPAPTPGAQLPACLRAAHEQLRAYFGRELHTFALPTDVQVGTAFQRRVWAALPTVGYGCTASYGHLARHLRQPGAGRAVGAANGQNPLAIVWPCHRIVGAGGQLTGYAGGLGRKQWLLAFEQPAQQGQLF